MASADIRDVLTFEPVPAGTRMRWSWHVEPRGLFKLLTPIVARIGQRQEAAIWANLKQCLERPRPHHRSSREQPRAVFCRQQDGVSVVAVRRGR